MLYIRLLIYLSISFIYANSFTFYNETTNKYILEAQRKLEEEGEKIIGPNDVLQLAFKIFINIYPDCSADLERIKPKQIQISLSKYPFIIDNIGKGLNDLGDEIECLNSFKGTLYGIATMNITNLINHSENKLKEFLNLTMFSLGACVTDNCIEPLNGFVKTFLNFRNATEGEKLFYKKNGQLNGFTFRFFFMWFIFFYIILKIIVGIFRLIAYPKGYDKEAIVIQQKKQNENENDEIKHNNEIDNKEELLNNNEESDSKEYNPKFDKTYIFPIYFRVIRFFDYFNDIILLSTNRNRYFNDNGLETINFLKTIDLYFIIFFNTFTSLFELPSKDILNRSFFSSKMIFIYRLSTHSIVCWIFLEAAYTTFKLMKFIKNQMKEYEKKNINKNNYIKLLIIYGKFLILFIPKILMFLLCYYIFYQSIIDYNGLFSAKTTYAYVHDKVITNNIKCDKDPSIIFTSFFTFTHNTDNFKTCYDFTFVYINIFFSTLIFMIILYVLFLFKSIIIEIIFIFINIGLFIGLMFTVDDPNKEQKFSDSEDKRYTYYHFRGQEYTNKIAYLSLGVYHLGFIIGLLCFNLSEIKDKQTTKHKQALNSINYIDDDNESLKKNNSFKNNSQNSQNLELFYYPLSFLNNCLKWLKKVSNNIKTVLILLCFVLMILLSLAFKLFEVRDIDKNDPDLDDRDFDLIKIYGPFVNIYFMYERHIFLLLYFIICLLLISLQSKGFYKKIFRFKLNTAISRTGFLITCLYKIFGYFSFCSFILKIKFNLPTFFIISVGNFLIIFIVCLNLALSFELPIRRIVKKIIREKEKRKNNII